MYTVAVKENYIMPRPTTAKTIQVSSELHEIIRKLADKEAEELNIPAMSMETYIKRLVQPNIPKLQKNS